MLCLHESFLCRILVKAAIWEFPKLISLVSFNERENLVFNIQSPNSNSVEECKKAQKKKSWKKVSSANSTTTTISYNPPLLFTPSTLLLPMPIPPPPPPLSPQPLPMLLSPYHHHHPLLVKARSALKRKGLLEPRCKAQVSA